MSLYNSGFSLDHFENKMGGAKKRKSSKKRKTKHSRKHKHHSEAPAWSGGAKKRKSSKRKSKSKKAAQHRVSHHMMPF